VSGCGEEKSGGDASVGDLGALGDINIAADDLAALPPDLGPCNVMKFGGFSGISTDERKLYCPCGCTIDAFEGTFVNSFWTAPKSTGATFMPTATGLNVTVTHAPGNGMLENGSLSSLNSAGPWYIDGDFDLLVDYRIAAPLPEDAHIVLGVQPQSGAYTLERGRSAAGVDQFESSFFGNPVDKPTSTLQGTLQLTRTGTTVQALADGTMVSQYTGATTGRVSMTLAAVQKTCVNDAGSGCNFTVTWHNLRLNRGTLVDRR
jgi:hypothetical protein